MLRRLCRSFPLLLAAFLPLLFAGWTLTAVFAQSSPSPSASSSANPSPSASASSGGGAAGDPTQGQQVYGSQDCAGCHGANLEGGVGPKLNPIEKLPGVSNPLDQTYLKTIIKNGHAGEGPYAGKQMPAHPNLSDTDLNNLVAFIIQSNRSGQTGLSPVDLARSNVFWVTVGISILVLVTWLLSRYNMRWIARRAAARREQGRGGV
jgi:mono/diheme cytochrome c family protein